MEDIFYSDETSGFNLRNEFFRYLSFWPWFICSLIFFLFSAYILIRYSTYQYKSEAIIEILDEAQDSEMALPTSLTVFNRSMVNLENEISILSSYSLHSQVVKELNSNVLFFIEGKIKASQIYPDDWFKDYSVEYLANASDLDSMMKFQISIDKKTNLLINQFNKDGEVIQEYNFEGLNMSNYTHSLPFNLNIIDVEDFSDRIMYMYPVSEATEFFRFDFEASALGTDSDQLLISLKHRNNKISREYLTALLNAFDRDGIIDRQLEYKRTIEFVNKRSDVLKSELEIIELEKQNFKKKNNLSDLSLDADANIKQQFSYNSELFNSSSQKSLANFLLESISENKYDYLPINIGLEDFDLNLIISEYNQLVTQRNKYLMEAGKNNFLVKSIESQLEDFIRNIKKSINNYLSSLEIKIGVLSEKENEFGDIYGNVPQNEKILRSIERELTVKEALFLLLLQKREEASINFAVVKPTIKVIDYPITNKIPVSPKIKVVFLIALLAGLLFPFSILYFRFALDNKIHNKDELSKLVKNIPIIAEIPYISDINKLDISSPGYSRFPLAESIRMLISNFKFIFHEAKSDSKTILVTSSIKGEGKTLISVNVAKLLSNQGKNKTILIGSDLRNPQIHKSFGVDKGISGLTQLLYKSHHNEFKDYIFKNQDLDIIFSGPIPPNPNELLASDTYKKLLNNLKKHYDYIIIDSAPCLVVSDTFEISNHIDMALYVFRANHTDSQICSFINEIKEQNKFTNLSIVLNGLGNSHAYGYKYGYQYGYRYSYNYGYGYGYKEDK